VQRTNSVCDNPRYRQAKTILSPLLGNPWKRGYCRGCGHRTNHPVRAPV